MRQLGSDQMREQAAGRVLSAPLNGDRNLLAYKAFLARRAFDTKAGSGLIRSRVPGIQQAESAASFLIPGDLSNVTNPVRSGGYSTVSPGGSNRVPGPLSPLGVAGRATGRTRGFRCPAGFQYGGRFTNERYSTCGIQLFDAPDYSGRTVGAARGTVANKANPGANDSLAEAATGASNTTSEQVLRMTQIPPAGPANDKNRDLALRTVAGMLADGTEGDARLIRRDGVVLRPIVASSVLRRFSDNPDMEGATLVRVAGERVDPDDLGLLPSTQVATVIIVLPDNRAVRVARDRELTIGERRKFGRMLNQTIGAAAGPDAFVEAITRFADTSDGALAVTVTDLPKAKSVGSTLAATYAAATFRNLGEITVRDTRPLPLSAGDHNLLAYKALLAQSDAVYGEKRLGDALRALMGDLGQALRGTHLNTPDAPGKKPGRRRRRLTNVNFDPDAIDADGDGLLQDNTPFERRVTRRIEDARSKPGIIERASGSLANFFDPDKPKGPGLRTRVGAKYQKLRDDADALLERTAGKIADSFDRAEKRRAQRLARRLENANRPGFIERASGRLADLIDRKPGQRERRGERASAIERISGRLADLLEGKPSGRRLNRRTDTGVASDAPNAPDAPDVPEVPKPSLVKPTKTTKKGVPGGQYGGAFTNETNAKKAAGQRALETGETLYLLKDKSGKFRVVDAERFQATKDADAILAYGPDGQVIDFFDPGDSFDELMADVAAFQAAEAHAAQQEALLAGTQDAAMTLTKSKTGMFLPDNLSFEMLGSGNDVAFAQAWAWQKLKVREFWKSVAIPGDNDEMTRTEFLALMDAYIAAQAAQPDANQKWLGVLRTERKNYVAMFIPDAGREMVDPLSRFNYVQPKRRAAIIADAKLHDFVVGKTTIKTKPVNASTNATEDLTDLGGDILNALSAPEVAPEVVPKPPRVVTLPGANGSPVEVPLDAYGNGLYGNPIDEYLSNPALKESIAESVNESLDGESIEIVGAAYLTEDGAVDWNKFETAGIQAHATINQAIDNGHDDFNYHPDTFDAQKHLEEITIALQDQYLLENHILPYLTSMGGAHAAEKHDFVDPPDDLVDQPSVQQQIDDYLAWGSASDFEMTVVNAITAPGQPLYIEPAIMGPTGPPDFADKKALDGWMLARELDGAEWLSEQDTIYSQILEANDLTWQQDSTKMLAVIAHAHGKEGIEKKIAAWRAQATEKLDYKESGAPNKPIDLGNAQWSGVAEAFNTPDFDYGKIESHESAKFYNQANPSLDSMIARGDKYGNDFQKLLDNLPENFGELTPDDQRAAMRTALGVSDDLTVAKVLARSAFSNQHGTADSLRGLRFATQIAALKSKTERDEGIATLTATRDLVAEQKAAAEELTQVTDALIALPSHASAPIRMYHEGKVATAQNKVAEVSVLQHLAVQADPNATTEQKIAAGQAMGQTIKSLPPYSGLAVSTQLNAQNTIKPGKSSPLVGKGMPKYTKFDSSLLGSLQEDGTAVAHAIPVGANGIWTQDDANDLVASGGRLSEIPDAYLKEAMWANTGTGKRFQVISDGSIQGGFNDKGQPIKDKTTGFVDTLTGNRYVIKTAHRNEQEHTQEIAAARVAQILGEPTTGIRFGSDVLEKPLPGHKASLEGKGMGLQRAIVMEHVANLYGGDGWEIIPFYSIPNDAIIDGESLARMMVLDRSINYFDRTASNIQAVRGPDGKVYLFPIDHGNAFNAFQHSTGKPEPHFGFIKTTKDDNINLHSMAQGLSAEEKRRFATAMLNATARYQKADFAKAFTDLGSTMGVSDAEVARLAKHAAFLEERKESLDWDTMVDQALTRIGLSPDEIADLRAGPASATLRTKDLTLPDGVATPMKAATALEEMSDVALFRAFLYDGDQIQAFHVEASEVQFRSQVLGVEQMDGTMLHFKRHGSATKVVPSTEDGWVLVGTGHRVPVKPHTVVNGEKKFAGVASFDLDNNQNLVGASGTTVSQWAKVLDDGTVVIITKAPTKNSADNVVRVILPGKPTTALADETRIANAMSAVGVKDHSPPTLKQMETYAVRSAYSMLFGPSGSKGSLVKVKERLAAEYGVTPDNMHLAFRIDGSMSVEFDNESGAKIKEATGAAVIFHSLTYGAGQEKASTAVITAILQGSFSPTTRRYAHGLPVTGGSSSSDVGTHGSGDYLFFFRKFNDNGFAAQDVDGMTFVAPAELAYRRTDWFTSHGGDTYGDINKRASIKAGHASHAGMESMFHGGADVTSGVIVVPNEQLRNEILAELRDVHGVESVGGVPLEDIIATKLSYAEKAQALIDRYADQGILIA